MDWVSYMSEFDERLDLLVRAGPHHQIRHTRQMAVTTHTTNTPRSQPHATMRPACRVGYRSANSSCVVWPWP
jgi:hypothetical protein